MLIKYSWHRAYITLSIISIPVELIRLQVPYYFPNTPPHISSNSASYLAVSSFDLMMRYLHVHPALFLQKLI